MTCDVKELLRRQAQWQKSRQALSWPEKIRVAEKIRDSIQTLRATSTKDVPKNPHSSPPTSPPASDAESKRGPSREIAGRKRIYCIVYPRFVEILECKSRSAALNAIAHIRQRIRWEVFDYQVLLDALSGYSKPGDKITRLLSDGAITRVKKGLYCFGEAFRRESVSREYLANLIYGPSYVSLDYALSHHGLIPERVETVTSVTSRRSRDFDTPLGRFTYRMLEGPRYALGAVREIAGTTTFLVASPEKALVDKVWTDKRFSGSRVSDYEAYLLDDLRLDRDCLSRLKRSRLRAIALAYDSPKINRLIRCLNRLKEAAHA